jgi:hypothetical protein
MTPTSSLITGLTAVALSIAVAAPAQAATTVANWQMNDTGTVMTDSSGNANNGVVKNVVRDGSAFTFQGKPSVVSVKHSVTLNPGTAAFTAAARIKFAAVPSAAVGDYDLVRKGLAGTAGGHWKMEIVRSGKAYCLFHGSAGRVVLSAGPNLANNAWHTISCQRVGSTVRLTVDGVTYSKNGPTGNIANTSTAYVGAKNVAGGDQYTGSMDWVTLTTG